MWALSRLVFLLNITLLHHPCDYVFWLYGHRLVALHLLPYRDFAVEYPPLATLLFALPGAAPTYTAYALGFAAVMALIDGVTLAGVVLATTRLGRPEARWQAAGAYTIGSLLTSAVLCKFDLLPGMLTLVAVVLLATGAPCRAWLSLALAVLCKGYPLALAPLFLLYQSCAYPRSRWWRGPLVATLCGAGVLGPLLLVAGVHGLQGPLYHARRGLQMESLYASVVLLLHTLGGLPLQVSPHDLISSDVFSPLNPALLAAVPWTQSGALALCYALAWLRVRATPTASTLLWLSMAVITAFLATFKALPTYYLLWVCPLVAVAWALEARGAVGLVVSYGLALSCGALIPMLWSPLQRAEPVPVAILVLRNVAIVGVLVVLLLRTWRQPVTDNQRGGDRCQTNWNGGSPASHPARATALDAANSRGDAVNVAGTNSLAFDQRG